MLIVDFGGLVMELLRKISWWCWLTGGMDWEEKEDGEWNGTCGLGKRHFRKYGSSASGGGMVVGKK